MKLLLDENLSDRLVTPLAELFPGSSHVKLHGQVAGDDETIWQFARDHGFVLVTKDRDFQQLCALRGAPPKVVWIRVGNRSSQFILDLIHRHHATLCDFAEDQRKALLILTDRP